MSKSKLVLALVSGLALPLGALAAEPATDKPAATGKPAPGGAEGRTASPMFLQLDADKDGYITAKEADKSATVKGNFKTMDKNSDGKVSADEWRVGGGL